MYPAEYRYTKQHEWIDVKGAVGTIGITEYAQQELGDVVFVELPKGGAAVKAGASFGTGESVKAVSEIFSPVSGEITGNQFGARGHSGKDQLRSARLRLAGACTAGGCQGDRRPHGRGCLSGLR